MSIFDRIKHAIFGEANAAPDPHASTPPAASSPASPAAPTSASVETSSTPPSQATPAATSSHSTPTPGPSSGMASAVSVDVGSILNEAVTKSGQKLDWRHSIVDLMKALGMDASLEERKELAQELGYSGDAHDSAKMNTFIHKALMKKLAENGGKVPAELLD